MPQEVPSLKPYYYRFTWLYIVITGVGVAAMLGLEFLLGTEVDLGAGFGIGATLGAGLGAATKFVHDQGRAPNAAERSRLVWGGVGILFLVSLAGMAAIFVVVAGSEAYDLLLYLAGLGNGLVLAIAAITLAFATAISFGLLYVAYGPWARNFASKRSLNQTEPAG